MTTELLLLLPGDLIVNRVVFFGRFVEDVSSRLLAVVEAVKNGQVVHISEYTH